MKELVSLTWLLRGAKKLKRFAFKFLGCCINVTWFFCTRILGRNDEYASKRTSGTVPGEGFADASGWTGSWSSRVMPFSHALSQHCRSTAKIFWTNCNNFLNKYRCKNVTWFCCCKKCFLNYGEICYKSSRLSMETGISQDYGTTNHMLNFEIMVFN